MVDDAISVGDSISGMSIIDRRLPRGFIALQLVDDVISVGTTTLTVQVG